MGTLHLDLDTPCGTSLLYSQGSRSDQYKLALLAERERERESNLWRVSQIDKVTYIYIYIFLYNFIDLAYSPRV